MKGGCRRKVVLHLKTVIYPCKTSVAERSHENGLPWQQSKKVGWKRSSSIRCPPLGNYTTERPKRPRARGILHREAWTASRLQGNTAAVFWKVLWEGENYSEHHLYGGHCVTAATSSKNVAKPDITAQSLSLLPSLASYPSFLPTKRRGRRWPTGQKCPLFPPRHTPRWGVRRWNRKTSIYTPPLTHL